MCVSCLVVSNSLRPHGLQPTRLLHPWDCPGKSTGVGCYCLLPPSTLSMYNARSTPGCTFQPSPCCTSEEAKHRQLCGLLKATQLGSWPGWVSSPGSQASESVPLKGQTTKHSPGTHLWERQIFIQCLIISDLRLLPGDSAGSSAWLPVAWATRPGFHCMCRPSPFLPCQKGRKCVPCVFFLLTFLSSKFVGLVSQSPDSDILMLALISKSKSDNILLEMHNFSERKHLTICIVNVPKRPLANKNDNKARWGFQIISAATIRHFSKCVHSCAVLSHSVVSHSLRLHELEPARLLCPWILQARILEWIAMHSSRGSSQPRDWTKVSCIAGRFFNCLCHQGSWRIVEWVAYPFSRGSSWPRNWTGVSCTEGRFSTSWASREPCMDSYSVSNPLTIHWLRLYMLNL